MTSNVSQTFVHVMVSTAKTEVRKVRVSDAGLSVVDRAVCVTPRPGQMVRDVACGVRPLFDELLARQARTADQVFSEVQEPLEKIVATVGAFCEPRVACAGVIKGISGESAKRAALAGGATVSDLVAIDDGRLHYQRVSDLRRQDVWCVVLAGGVDEGILADGAHQILNVARVLAEGIPVRRETGEKVPVIYAASAEARQQVMEILGSGVDVIWTENVRPWLETENLEPARKAVAGLFSREALKFGPFKSLGQLGFPEIMPAGFAAGRAFEAIFEPSGPDILGVSLDGDSVQVFSVVRGIFTRSITPVQQVSPDKVVRWLPSPGLAAVAEDALANWKLSPWVFPLSWEEMALYLAFLKEAVREAIEEHRRTAVELRGIHRRRTISETFQVRVSGGDTLIKMNRIGRIVVTGALAQALSENTIMSLVLDGIQPCGYTEVYVDPDNFLETLGCISNGLMHQLVLRLMRPLGAIISPGESEERTRTRWAYLSQGLQREALPFKHGEISVISLNGKGPSTVIVEPSGRDDFGNGEGRSIEHRMPGNMPRLYLDGRPRPWLSAMEKPDPVSLCAWYRSTGVLPDTVLADWVGRR